VTHVRQHEAIKPPLVGRPAVGRSPGGW
jgi:hypothetical protein